MWVADGEPPHIVRRLIWAQSDPEQLGTQGEQRGLSQWAWLKKIEGQRFYQQRILKKSSQWVDVGAIGAGSQGYSRLQGKNNTRTGDSEAYGSLMTIKAR